MAIKTLSEAYDELRRKIDAYEDAIDTDLEMGAASDLATVAELVLELAGHNPG
ncbi:hypothetical protein [Mycobacteroides abscessus]|uniref:hypothetical protein n=1 Tax=Mycobacteroides abscessus TaxID=36809 RepID=UPI0009CD9A4E|nr:hypothetical protein [Mycobacteroides abscessus]SLC72482.1 Uncharacterised protein [Mycobacteroides abscessus subsp. massiliense]SLJ50291.1 Uncharacterised protein [Mycobacteroides abscessus subsp. abscessus]